MKLKSYKVPLLESATEQIMQACRASEAVARGPVRLPTKKKIFCVLRSPHVNKDSREHFEVCPEPGSPCRFGGRILTRFEPRFCHLLLFRFGPTSASLT